MEYSQIHEFEILRLRVRYASFHYVAGQFNLIFNTSQTSAALRSKYYKLMHDAQELAIILQYHKKTSQRMMLYRYLKRFLLLRLEGRNSFYFDGMEGFERLRRRCEFVFNVEANSQLYFDIPALGIRQHTLSATTYNWWVFMTNSGIIFRRRIVIRIQANMYRPPNMFDGQHHDDVRRL